MKDIIDLILDLEKKVLFLLRDLIRYPERIARAIVEKDKTYLGAFKFYSLVTSLWIIFYQLGNTFFDFFAPTIVVPQRIDKFIQAQQDFELLIAPFAGLIEAFIPFGLIGYFLFRKQNLKLLDHINLNIYLGAMLLLFEIPVLIILFIIGEAFDTTQIFFFQPMAVLMLIGVPLAYYGFVHVRIFPQRKVLTFFKPVLAIALVGIVFALWVWDGDFHHYAHRRLLYSRFHQFELKPDIPEDQVNYYVVEYDDEWAAIQHTTGNGSHNIVTTNDDGVTQLRTLNGTEVSRKFLDSMNFDHSYSVQQLNGITTVLSIPFRADSVVLYTFDQAETVKRQRIFHDLVSIRSRFARFPRGYLFTGYSLKKSLPVAGKLNASDFSVAEAAEMPGLTEFGVDDMEATDTTGTMELLLFHSGDDKLREIRWLKGKTDGSTWITKTSATIFRNEFSPTPDFAVKWLHNGLMTRINDTTTIVAFQVMTDSSFTVDVTTLDNKNGAISWSENYTVPADLSFYDHLLADNDRIYILGRAVSIFTRRYTSDYVQFPYIQTIDAKTGNLLSTFFLPMEDTKTHYVNYLHYVYSNVTSAYQDDERIYYCIDGQHNYVIQKRK